MTDSTDRPAKFVDDIVFPRPVCIDGKPHAPHPINGTWRDRCPGRTTLAAQRAAAAAPAHVRDHCPALPVGCVHCTAPATVRAAITASQGLPAGVGPAHLDSCTEQGGITTCAADCPRPAAVAAATWVHDLDDYMALRPASVTTAQPCGAIGRHGLDEESARVLEAIPTTGTATPEDLAARVGLDVRIVLRRLALLETAGLVNGRESGVGGQADRQRILDRISRLSDDELRHVEARLNQISPQVRETVWCEAHGGLSNPHFERADCLHPHFTDPQTRARLNAAARRHGLEFGVSTARDADRGVPAGVLVHVVTFEGKHETEVSVFATEAQARKAKVDWYRERVAPDDLPVDDDDAIEQFEDDGGDYRAWINSAEVE